MKDAISYVRVSSEEQADSGLGLEAQRQRITAYCTMKGLHLAEEFEDPGVSAGKPLASRPAGSKLLAAAKKSKAVVVVAKLDRLFRSVADAANVIDEFDKRGRSRIVREGLANAFGKQVRCAGSTPEDEAAALQFANSPRIGPSYAPAR